MHALKAETSTLSFATIKRRSRRSLAPHLMGTRRGNTPTRTNRPTSWERGSRVVWIPPWPQNLYPPQCTSCAWRYVPGCLLLPLYHQNLPWLDSWQVSTCSRSIPTWLRAEVYSDSKKVPTIKRNWWRYRSLWPWHVPKNPFCRRWRRWWTLRETMSEKHLEARSAA